MNNKSLVDQLIHDLRNGKTKSELEKLKPMRVWSKGIYGNPIIVLEECTGNPAVEASWHAADKPTSNSASVVVKPMNLNVPTWWRATGWNAAGEGAAPSDAFGGDPIQ